MFIIKNYGVKKLFNKFPEISELTTLTVWQQAADGNKRFGEGVKPQCRHLPSEIELVFARRVVEVRGTASTANAVCLIVTVIITSLERAVHLSCSKNITCSTTRE